MKPLKRIYIEITNICNLSCSFCPETKRSKQILTSSQFASIIKQAADYTNHIYFHVKGEPLLHPELDKLLSLCHELNLQVNLTTNGTMLKERKDILLHSPALRQLNISLHSFESTNDQVSLLDTYLDEIITSSKEFQNTTNTIIALRLWNLDKNNLADSIKEQNKYVLHKLENGFELDYSISEQFLSSNSPSHGKNTKIPRGIKLSERIYLNQSYEFMWPSLDAPFFGESGYCHGLKDQIAILADGTVVPCCLDGEGVIALGNINHTPLSEIISNKRAVSIKNGFASRTVIENLCKHCGYRERFGS